MFLIDTDIGSDVDDAFALYTILKLKPESVLGITTVYADAKLRAKIVKKLLKSLDIDIPVYAGEDKPLFSPDEIWTTGLEGKGVLFEEDLKEEIHQTVHASEFIVSQVKKYKGQVSLICIAPLTNIAKALEIEPNLFDYVKDFYFMGAGITSPESVPKIFKEGKVYKAEPSHNIRCDVKAAQEVFSKLKSAKIVTNDVSYKALLSRKSVEKFFKKKGKNQAEVYLESMLKVWLNYRSKIFGQKVRSTVLHDVLVIFEALGKSLVDYVSGELNVLDDGSTEFVYKENGSTKLSYNVDELKFLKLLKQEVLEI